MPLTLPILDTSTTVRERHDERSGASERSACRLGVSGPQDEPRHELRERAAKNTRNAAGQVLDCRDDSRVARYFLCVRRHAEKEAAEPRVDGSREQHDGEDVAELPDIVRQERVPALHAVFPQYKDRDEAQEDDERGNEDGRGPAIDFGLRECEDKENKRRHEE
jgi:hypothetical protein